MNLREHLSPEQLTAYVRGWLDDSTSDSIEQHLAQCPECEETLVALEDDCDTLVRHLRETDPDDRPVTTGQPVGVEVNVLPHRFGAYELQERIGQGGMGAVYRGRHVELNKSFAIKLVHLPERMRDQGLTRFQREVRAAGSLSHPAIVAATDAGQHDQIHYLVMELIDGNDMGKIVRAVGQLSVADACEIIRVVADGLAHAHAAGVVHRDVKPSNVMLSKSGEVKVLDFGLAQLSKWDDVAIERTTVGQLMGTLDYMAPEQAERPETVDFRADLYALGATLFRLLCGRPPLSAAPNLSPLAKLRLLANHSPPRADTLRKDLPKPLADLIASLLASDPDNRPPSASHVAESLQPFCQGNDLVALAREGAQTLEASSASPHSLASVPSQTVPRDLHSVPPSRTSRSRWLAAATLPLIALAGIWFTLQLQKGQLIIDSEAEVTIKLAQNGETYQQVEVHPGTNKTSLYAGEYEVTIDDGSDSFSIDKETIELKRGEVVIARISTKALSTEEPVDAPRSAFAWLPASDAPLRPGDKLRIVSAADESLNTTVTVLSDDTIKLRLVGVVSTEQKTVVELEKTLNDTYRQFFNHPGVEVFRDMGTPTVASKTQLRPGMNSGQNMATVEPLYDGKSFSEWLQLLQWERSPDGFAKALAAISRMAEQKYAEQLTKILTARLQWLAENRYELGSNKNEIIQSSVFSLLAKLNPGQQYVRLLMNQLKDADSSVRAQILIFALRKGIMQHAGESLDIGDIRLWIESEVLQGSEHEKLVDIAGELYLRWYEEGAMQDTAIQDNWVQDDELLEVLAESPRLSTRFWSMTLMNKPYGELVSSKFSDIEDTWSDPNASDQSCIDAVTLFRSITQSRAAVLPEFTRKEEMTRQIAARLNGAVKNERVQYEIVDAKWILNAGMFQPSAYPLASHHDWYVERIRFTGEDNAQSKVSPLYNALDFISMVGWETSIEEELKQLQTLTKPGRDHALQFLSDRSLSKIELLWPAMTPYQFELRDKGVVISASQWDATDWFDVFTYERVSRMLQKIEMLREPPPE